ncbi:hypothetical protein [Fibrobacter sp.]|nr:hypothetical protein [Fibrobacter sp.]MBR3073777.1 hypothetical protein [Fibrobacter sp.]
MHKQQTPAYFGSAHFGKKLSAGSKGFGRGDKAFAVMPASVPASVFIAKK